MKIQLLAYTGRHDSSPTCKPFSLVSFVMLCKAMSNFTLASSIACNNLTRRTALLQLCHQQELLSEVRSGSKQIIIMKLKECASDPLPFCNKPRHLPPQHSGEDMLNAGVPAYLAATTAVEQSGTAALVGTAAGTIGHEHVSGSVAPQKQEVAEMLNTCCGDVHTFQCNAPC